VDGDAAVGVAGRRDDRGPASEINEVPGGQLLIDPARGRGGQAAGGRHDPLVPGLLLRGEGRRRGGHLTPDHQRVRAMSQHRSTTAGREVGRRAHVVLVEVGQDDLPQPVQAQAEPPERRRDRIALPRRPGVDQGQRVHIPPQVSLPDHKPELVQQPRQHFRHIHDREGTGDAGARRR
jgi:hypothetical protein